jgi:hypothetical protein
MLFCHLLEAVCQEKQEIIDDDEKRLYGAAFLLHAFWIPRRQAKSYEITAPFLFSNVFNLDTGFSTSTGFFFSCVVLWNDVMNTFSIDWDPPAF